MKFPSDQYNFKEGTCKLSGLKCHDRVRDCRSCATFQLEVTGKQCDECREDGTVSIYKLWGDGEPVRYVKLCSERDYVNFAKWLRDNPKTHRDVVLQGFPRAHLPMLIAALERGKLNIDMEEVR
jgi:hypothetical protein